MFSRFITRLPISDAMTAERAAVGQLSQTFTEQVCPRYELHSKMRHRFLSDFGVFRSR